MVAFEISLCLIVFFHAVHGQGSFPAKVNTPIVQSSQGKEARLSCAVTSENDKPLERIRFCVWERLQQAHRSRKNDHAFIINFNDINSQPGLYSGVSGYSYSGEGFSVGECGVKISFVKTEDIAKWQCTLITDEKVFRGYVDLVKVQDQLPYSTKPENNNSLSVNSSKSAVASSRTAIDNDKQNGVYGAGVGGGDDMKARPIITSYNDARSIIQPEIIVHSTSANESPQLIQEVKVESAGLEIKPRRGGKLIVFE